MPTGQLIILKFGSSVIQNEDSLPTVVDSVAEQVRAGRRVVAVVSAMGDTTHRLALQGQNRKLAPEGHAALLATGEEQTVSLLAAALAAADLPCTALDLKRLGLRTRGPVLDGQPVGFEGSALESALLQHPVVVVPGFVGIAHDGSPSLLGMGGSDLTAVFLAHTLGAATCRLHKDVDGIYEHDPSLPGPKPRRYLRMTWSDALALDGGVLQKKALRFARARRQAIEIASPRGHSFTQIGTGPTTFA